MVRKVGGSRGNPPCVSCHWLNARRVPAKDCIVWCMEDTTHVLPLLSLLFSLIFFFFKLSPTSNAEACLFKWNTPLPPVFKMRAERKRGKEDVRFENRSHLNAFILESLTCQSAPVFVGSSSGSMSVQLVSLSQGPHLISPMFTFSALTRVDSHPSSVSQIGAIVIPHTRSFLPGKLGLN